MVRENLRVFREPCQVWASASCCSKRFGRHRLALALRPSQEAQHIWVFAVQVKRHALPPHLAPSLPIEPWELQGCRFRIERRLAVLGQWFAACARTVLRQV